MAVLKRGETTIGPLAFGGRTITLVARTTALHVGDDARGALHVRSRPVHVEVLDGEGRREVVHVRDIEHTLMVAIRDRRDRGYIRNAATRSEEVTR